MLRAMTAATLLLATLPSWALDFDIGPIQGTLSNDFTVGATLRMEDRDPALIAKGNLQPGLCTRTNRTTDSDAETLTYPGAQAGDIGSTCNSTTDPSLNLAYVQAPGSFNINGDNGNLNFDRYDLVAAAAKLSSKFNLSWNNVSVSGRSIWFFDEVYTDFSETHTDTGFQRAQTAFAAGAQNQFGGAFDLTELSISTFIPIGDRTLTLRAGDHGLNWGESTALPLNSLNSINPPDLRRTRIPGFDLDELFQAVGMVSMGLDLSLNLSMEAFYQYDWKPALIDAPGSFYSTSDLLGGDAADRYFAMLSFGKAPEDPDGLYSSQDNGDDPFALGSAAGRTIYRTPDRNPRDDGQYGIALKYFAENFNNGTEFAVYYANYHSRIPSASFVAADASCATNSTDLVSLIIDCGALQGDKGTLRLTGEPLPVDTVSVFAEYPEDIQMYGLSFNTSFGSWAWSGEYTFRPNMPVQIQTVDLLFAALQPAFPLNNINVGVPDLSALAGLPLDVLDGLNQAISASPLPATVLPSRRVAVPDYVETLYRGNTVQAGDYIQGFERLKLGQATSTLIRTYGGDNFLRASQIAVVIEAGVTHVVDMPKLSQLQFQGAETNTHASSGADGSVSQVGDSASIASNGDGDARCVRQAYNSIGGLEAEPCRQNPTTQNAAQFGDDLAYGIRMLSVLRYQDAMFGANLDTILGLFYDIEGVAPGLGQNFSEGDLQAILGFKVEYLSRWSGEVRYTYLDGDTNARRDRDTLALTVRYGF